MKCKYYDRCEYASSAALTCSEDGGGTYCGKYRMFAAEQASKASVPVIRDLSVDIRKVLSN
jgi:hypothetical protein